MSEATRSKIKSVEKEFSFELTQAEMAAKAIRMGELYAALDAAENTLDAAKTVFKQAEAVIRSETAIVVDAIRTKREMRTVECDEVHDFEANRVYWADKTTYKILGERPMTPQERQMALNLGADEYTQKTGA